MFRITDKRGYDYYMTEANLPEYYQSYDNKLSGAVNFIKQASLQGDWILCYLDTLLRDAVVILASEVYVVQEVTKK